MENTIQLEKKDTNTIIKSSLKNAINYKIYRELTQLHVENKTSSNESPSEVFTQFTALNHSRMKRLDKTLKFSEDITKPFKNFKGNITWLVITESWCGDAAQALPVLNKLSEISSGIDLKIVLRDKNIELMNKFLTRGSMSIPKLIAIDNDKKEIVGTWGPRPTLATQMVEDFKKENGSLTPEFKKELQVWYNKDKGQNMVEDLVKLIR